MEMNDFHFLKKPTQRVRFKLEKIIKEFRHGVHRSAMAGRGTDFRGIREYHPGDPISSIDHLASARLSDDEFSLVVRDYQPDREVGVVCALDVGVTMRSLPIKLERASFFVWLFALSAFQYRDRFKLLLFTDSSVKSSEWVRSEESLEETIFEDEQTDILNYIMELNLKNTLLFMISDFVVITPDYLQKLKTIDFFGNNLRGLVFGLDEWEGFTPRKFDSIFRDPMRLISQRIDMRPGKGAHKEWKENKEHFDAIQKVFRSVNTPFIRIPLIDDDPLEKARRELLKLGFE